MRNFISSQGSLLNEAEHAEATETQQTNRVVNTIESDVAYIGLYWPLELKSKVRKSNVVRRAYRCTPQTSANFTWRACDRTRELNVAVCDP
jgi:hypothetical protein